jgi:hypothetical protein
VSHDQLRALVPAYAAGELAGAEADTLRAHLAGGCEACLEDMFRRPVGLPRIVSESPVSSAMRRRLASLGLLGGLAAVALAVVAVRAIGDLRRWQVSLREEADRRALVAAEGRAALEARVRRLQSEVDGARAEASAQAEAARAMRAENARLEAALRDAAGRPVPSPAPTPRPMRQARSAPRSTVEAPPAAPQLGRLQAVPPFRDPHGHILWNPGRSELKLYAIGLPPLPTGAGYRLRYRLGDGRLETGPTLQPAPDGAISRVVTVTGDGVPVSEVEIILEPSARTVVAGRLDGPQ